MDYKSMTVEDLNTYIKEQEPIKEKNMEAAYAVTAPDGGPDMAAFQRLSEEALEPIWKANLHLKTKITDWEMEPHDNNGDLMTFEDFKDNVDSGGFIDYDGHGYYANDTEQSDIMITPSDIKEDVYRKDFTHIKWYNR